MQEVLRRKYSAHVGVPDIPRLRKAGVHSRTTWVGMCMAASGMDGEDSSGDKTKAN